MKKIVIIMISLTLSMGAFAQRKGFYAPRTHIIVAPLTYSIGIGYPWGYPYFGYPFFGYPYGYGFSPYGYMPMSSYNLNRQIQYIRSEYSYKIKSVRKDKSLTKSQRKQQILSLKSERENAIGKAEANYQRQRANYRGAMNNNQNPGTNNNQDPGTNDNQNPGSGNNQNSGTSDHQNS